MAALALTGACTGDELGAILTPLPDGRVVLVNASLLPITAASVTQCDAVLPVPVVRLEAPIAPGARWVVEVPGGCYRLTARTADGPFEAGRFDLPPNGAYRVTLRSDL